MKDLYKLNGAYRLAKPPFTKVSGVKIIEDCRVYDLEKVPVISRVLSTLLLAGSLYCMVALPKSEYSITLPNTLNVENGIVSVMINNNSAKVDEVKVDITVDGKEIVYPGVVSAEESLAYLSLLEDTNLETGEKLANINFTVYHRGKPREFTKSIILNVK